jgi:glutathione gamma-glutamylcysteinyltransferase
MAVFVPAQVLLQFILLSSLLIQAMSLSQSDLSARTPSTSVSLGMQTTSLSQSDLSAPTPSASVSRGMKSFYRRPLPESCIALTSKEGRKLFESALRSKGLKVFFALIDQHSTQSEPAFCGLSTLLIALNTFAVDPRQTWKGPWRWYDENVLNCCMDLDTVKKSGITLPGFRCLAVCQGLDVAISYADDTGSCVQEFRKAVQRACGESESPDDGDNDKISHILVVSYTRKALGQTGTGHFSPIAAYDSVSDSVLILDTARFKYGSHWVKLPLIYEAMKPVDPSTGRSRGYVMLEYDHEYDEHHTSSLALSVLLRSRMKQNPVRREFKRYLESLPPHHRIGWEEVVKYWTKDRTAPKYIWEIMDPQLKPMSDESDDGLYKEVLSLIADLIPSDDQLFPQDGDCCRSNHRRTVSVCSEEAIFILYLACLDKERREKMIFSSELSSASSRARQQLLVEAKLVEIAIKMSDEMVVTPSAPQETGTG